MTKKIIIFAAAICVFGALAAPAMAGVNLGGSWVGDAAKQAGYGETTETTLAEIIGTIIKAVLSLMGVIFTFLIAYAGDMWMMARGEQEKIDKAKKIITGSILGLVTTLAAYMFANFAVGAVLKRATQGSAGQVLEMLETLLSLFS